MTSSAPDRQFEPPDPADFESTRWSLVVRAGNRQAQDADQALAWLCERYWYPLYAYVRRRNRDVHEAQDQTQAFFARLVEKNILASAAPERGRFRSFLLTALKNFLANEWDRTHAQKRGGARPPLSLDLATAESRLTLEPGHDLTPERVYERQWVLTLLQLVVTKLESEFAAAGKGRHFELLKGAISGDADHNVPYATAAAELDMSEPAVRQAARRLRQRYRELLRAEVAETVADPAEIDDEIRSLFEILGG
jgi:RNA polymerase sigma-70 factor (ECF subfamily)